MGQLMSDDLVMSCVGIVNNYRKCRGCHGLGVVEMWIEFSDGRPAKKGYGQPGLCLSCMSPALSKKNENAQ